MNGIEIVELKFKCRMSSSGANHATFQTHWHWEFWEKSDENATVVCPLVDVLCAG